MTLRKKTRDLKKRKFSLKLFVLLAVGILVGLGLAKSRKEAVRLVEEADKGPDIPLEDYEGDTRN